MDFLNGKKTVIGTIMLALSVWLPQFGIDGQWIQWLVWIGTAMGGVGTLHKGVKGELSKQPGK